MSYRNVQVFIKILKKTPVKGAFLGKTNDFRPTRKGTIMDVVVEIFRNFS